MKPSIRRSFRLLAFAPPALLAVASAPFACVAGQEADVDEATLRARFPGQASRVLDEASGFVEGNEGFAPAAIADARLALSLPRNGDDALVFTTPDGFSVRVHEMGVSGDARLVSRAVAYARAGGTAFWTAKVGGYEEWLWLDAEATRTEGPVVTWRIEGAKARQMGEAVELDDEAGRARIRVTAPEAYTIDGAAASISLRVQGDSIELFVDAKGEEVLVDPDWTATGSLLQDRAAQTAVLLPDGRVLVAGGGTSAGGAGIASVEAYTPATGTWASAAPLLAARYWHRSIIANGKAMVVGGFAGFNCMNTTEVYDAMANAWTAGPTMPVGQCNPAVVGLAGGKTLFIGSLQVLGSGNTVNIYDPATNAFTAGAPMPTSRVYHTATLLPDGRVFVTGGTNTVPGGSGLATTEFYLPMVNSWQAGPPMPGPRRGHSATLLPNGKVLIAGGSDGNPLATTFFYEPATNTYSLGPTMTAPHAYHTANVLPNGKILVAGGGSMGTTATNVAEIYDPATNTWTATTPMTAARIHHTATNLADGRVLAVAGGTTGDDFNISGTMNSAELFATTLANGAACAMAGDCLSGFCIDGVCCNNACAAGACDACSVAAGAPVNGTCALLTGTACSDGNGCTTNDVCQAGTCTSGAPVVCAPIDACHTAGTCNPMTGACSPSMPKADGAACDDGNACSQTDVCQAGACVGANPVVCAPVDSCHDVGVCNSNTGLCSSPIKPDGATCDDSDACTVGGTCLAGACQPGPTMECAPPDACHEPGACNPINGVCSYPNKPDGAPCNGNGTCQNGTCTSGSGSGGGGGSGSGGGSGGGGGSGSGSGGAGGSGSGSGSGGAGGSGSGGAGGSGSGSGSGGSGGENVNPTGGGTTTDPGGCGCHIADDRPIAARGSLFALLALAFAARRRRR